jgi:guanine deaminase
LGTDCSGGPNPSILSTLRSAAHTSRMISFLSTSSTPYKSLALSELWYLATIGGASLCRLDNVIGNFEVGKEFDALRVKPQSMGLWTGSKDEGVRLRFERWVWGGDDRDLADVWVRGKRVAGSA